LYRAATTEDAGMTVVRPDFLKVLPDDVARVGLDGAVLLALVRYATALSSECNGRMVIDDAVWWHTSHNDIGKSLGGVSHDIIRRLVSKLESVGALRICVPDVDNNRLKAYRLADLQLRDSTSPLTCNDAIPRNDDAIPRNGNAIPRSPLRDSASFTTSLKNLKEEKEERERCAGASAPHVPDNSSSSLSVNGYQANNVIDVEVVDAEPVDSEPAQHCRAHMPYGTSDSCGACKTARLNHDAWFKRQTSGRLQRVWDRYDAQQRERQRYQLKPREAQPTPRNPPKTQRRLEISPSAMTSMKPAHTPRVQQILDEAAERGRHQRAAEQARRGHENEAAS
jgi:hypothetical protein